MNTFKKILISVLIVILLVFIGTFIFKQTEIKNESKIKEGWYIEITNEYINVRKDADQYSSKLTEVKKGDFYKVLEMDLEDNSYYWYKIEMENGKTGWVASGRKNSYVKDFNNPTDIATPTVKFQDEEYYVNSINDINYNHLQLWDDKPGYVVTHTVYHEFDNTSEEIIDQYWIVYRIEDKTGKYEEKTQKIVFTIIPTKNQVKDFYIDYLGGR